MGVILGLIVGYWKRKWKLLYYIGIIYGSFRSWKLLKDTPESVSRRGHADSISDVGLRHPQLMSLKATITITTTIITITIIVIIVIVIAIIVIMTLKGDGFCRRRPIYYSTFHFLFHYPNITPNITLI